MGNNLDALTTVFTEFYYWITLPLMFLIHVGFCMYEVGASRRRNHMHTLMKNSMIIPLVTVTFYYFGWWLYDKYGFKEVELDSQKYERGNVKMNLQNIKTNYLLEGPSPQYICSRHNRTN